MVEPADRRLALTRVMLARRMVGSLSLNDLGVNGKTAENRAVNHALDVLYERLKKREKVLGRQVRKRGFRW